LNFPSIIIDAKTLEEVDRIQIYVKPVIDPILTKFCIKLTGIKQSWVDNAVLFPEAFKTYIEWLAKNGLNLESNPKNFTFITCGDWDLRSMLPRQCALVDLKIPSYFKSWINIKRLFGEFYNKKKVKGMTDMLSYLSLKLIGRHHSGIDDCTNISQIVIRMLQEGAVLEETCMIKL